MSLGVSLDVLAFTTFAEKFLVTPEKFPDGVWRYLRDFRPHWETHPESILGLATSAFAFAILSYTRRTLDVLAAGSTKYIHVIAKIKKALKDTAQAVTI